MATTKETLDKYLADRKQGKYIADRNSTRGVLDAYLAQKNYSNIGKDIIDINNAITDAYSGWKDADTMKGYTSSLSSTLDKVKGYKDYLTRYYGNDANYAERIKTLADVEDYFNGATDNLNYLTSYYGSHTNAKSFADQKAKDDAKAAELLKLQELAKNADFADRSGYIRSADLLKDRSSGASLYMAMNGDAGWYLGGYDPTKDNSLSSRDVSSLVGVKDTMTDEEKALYYYIANTQGYQSGQDYLLLMQDTLNYRKGKEIANSWAGRNLPILTSLVSGVDSAQQGFTNAVNSIVNPNKERPTSAMQYAGGLVGQREMEEGVVQGLAAQISQSIGQMTPQILVSLATGNVGGAAKGVASAASKILSMATLGASVYGNAYNEALQRGQDGWRAYGYGLGNAAVEIAAESFADGINLISSGSWGKALATKLTGNKFKAVTEIVAEIADKPRIKYLLDALGEGAEEVFSTALEPALESFFLKETFDPASVEEMLYSGLLGALTSGVMNAAGLPGQVANYKYYSGMNQTLNDADIDTIRAEAMQMGKKSKSYNAAKEFEGVETKDLANRHRRRILEAFNTENREKTNEIVGTAVARNYAESEKVNDNVDKAAEKAAEMKGKYNTATDGKAYTKDDTEADFSDFTETVEIDEEGNAVFTAKDGRTLSTADDVVPEIVAEGVAMLANLPSIPKSAYSTYFQYLPKQTNTKAYTAAFETLFEMGKNAEGMKLATSAAFADAELDELSQGAIYLQGVNTRKSADEAFKDAVTKARSAAEKNGKFNAKKGKLNDEAVRNMKLTRAQKNAITMLSSFTEFGINVEIYASTEANRKNTPNGWFDSTTGTIHLDINAGENADVVGSGVFWTIAHESTHMIKVTAPEAYKVLQEYVLDEMFETEDALNKAIGEEMMRHDLQHPNEPKMTRAEAIEEIVARSCESIFADSDQLTKMLIEGEARKEGFVDKVINTIQKVIEKITAFFQTLSSEYNPESKEGKFFSETAERMLKLKEIYDNAFAEAVEGAKVVYGTELTPGEEGVVVDADGNPVAYATKTGSVMLSMRTYREEGKDAFRKYLEKCVKNKSLTQEEMTEMLDGIEEIYKICSEFKDKYAPFSKWSDAEVIRDTKGKPVFSVVTPNGEYKMNLDFSLVCKKRRTLDAVFNEMARRGTIDNFELGQKSIVKINEIIRKYGFETACALCFVDAKRFRQASMADAFVNLYNELVRSLVSEENQEDIGFYNFSGNITVKNVESKIDRWESSKLDFSHINHVMKTYDEGTVEYKAAKYIKNNAHARKLLLRGDFMSSAGFDSVKKGDPQILKLYNSKKGTGGPKAAFGDVQYFNEIIKKAKSWTPSKAYSVGGIRVQSFSDYVPRMVFDYVQMIYDLAATKLPAHAYSKEALFVKQFGLTGIKINMSLIPAVAKDGIAPGLDKNGNYVWAGESFDFDTAKKIQNADGYTENCGTIAVGVSYAHIMKLLSDPDIRMVIPYHKSGLNPIVAHMNRISAFTDYTSLKTNPGGGQHTTTSDGKNVEKEFDFNKALREIGDPKAAVQAYLDWCEKNEYSPKFAEFSQHANYYKLLIDFTVYDRNGNYVPQRATEAVFPKGEDAFGSMKELIEEGLEEDAIIEGKRDARLGDIVDEIERTIPKTEAEIAEEEVPQAETDVEARIMRSDRSTQRDAEYLDAVKRGDMETAQRMVDEAAKEWGAATNGNVKRPRSLHLYHGTGKFGFTRFRDGAIFATASESVAAGYNRGQGLGRVRSSSLKYIPNDGTAETAIKNAKNVLGTEFNKLDETAKQNIIRKADKILKDVAAKIAELDDGVDYDKVSKFFEYLAEKYGDDKSLQWTNEFYSLKYMLVSDYSAAEMLEDGAWLKHDVERYHEWKQSLSKLWAEEREAIKNSSLDKTFSYILGFEYGDYLFDIEYGLSRLLDDRAKLVNRNGYLVYLDNIIDSIESIKDTGIYDLYGNPGDKPLTVDEGERFWDAIPFDGGFRSTDYIVKWAKNHGYTSVLFKSVLDPSSGGSANIYADEWVFFDPNQVKSADPVTYDDNGNVIPLSERFKSENADIRYSDRSRNIDRDILESVLADSSLKQRYFSQRVFLQKYQDAQTSYNKALEEIEKYSAEEEELHSKIEKIIQNVPPEKLRGIHSRLFRIGEGNFRVNEKYLNGVAKRLISATDTRYSITEVAEMLNDVYAKWSTSSVDNKMIQRDAQALYKKLLGNVRYTGSESNEAFEGAYRDITRVKIALSETQKAELEYAFGKKWRRELFGKFKFSDDGVSLDSRWQEWADMYPHIFDSDTTSAEMATKLVEIRDMVKPGSYAVTEINPAEVSSFARDLYRNYIMAPGVMDFLQKNAEFKHLPGMYNRLREVQGIINRQYERMEAAEEKMFTYEAEGLRDVIDSEINRLNEVARKTGVESRREAIRERVERASRAAEISTISNYVKKTLKLFEGDTKKQYVPEVLKAPIVEFLTFFDFTKAKTNGGVTQQSARLDDAVQALLSVDTEDFDKVIADFEQAVKDNSFGEDTFAFDINEDVVNELKVKFESIKAEIKRFENLESTQRNIYNMDAEALADLKDALRTIYTIVKQANTLIASGMSIADAANGTIDHIKGTKADVSRAGTAARKAYFSLVDPIRFFSRLGSEAAEIFRQLRIADSRRAFMIKRVQDFLQTSVGAEKIKAWKKETHKIDGIPVLDSEGNVIPGDGETIEVTTPQLMALYAHWRRDQSRKHLADSDDDGNERKSGGGVFRTKHKSGEDTFSERIRFSQEIFDKMTSVLTDEQKDVVVKLQDYMSNEISELGNMVTMKRFGLNAFTEKNYIPIVTRVGDVINEEGGGGSNLLKIIGKSWTKKTNDNASNTIIIDDFFDVFSKHVAEMIDYNAFAIPLLDAVRWLNFKETANGADKSVRAALKNSFGNDGVEFIKTLIEDINGSSAKPSGGIGMQKVVLRNVKTALVGGKLKQIFLQPTAIVRASEILGGKNITKAIGIIGKTKGAEDNVNKTFELATKWSGVALWKSMGYIGVNMSGRTFAETILYGDSGGFWDTIKDTGKALKNKEFEEAYENAIDLGLKPMEIGDKYGWAMLWKASEYKVSETQKNLVPKSDEYYKAVAEVFEEAVYKTQVSDSVLSKPSVLRSKNSLTTISASFMSEPIKSLEWVLDSYAKFVEDTKTMGAKAAFAKNKGNMIRAMWGLTASSIITAIVTSAADTFGDDEESWLDYKIFLKKFFGKHFFDGNLWDELDPLRKIPYVNEIVSIFQKYDPSRLDLESFNEIEQAITALINYFSGKGNYTGIGVVVQTLEALALTTGLPIQNVVKDIKDVWNATVGEAFEDYEIKEKKK